MPTLQAPPHPDDVQTVEQLLGHFASLEQQLAEVREALTHSHRLATLGTIASIIAHEYNNILTPIVSYCQLAQAAPDDIDGLRKAVEKSLAGAEKAAQISSSLLGFAREADEAHVTHLPTVAAEAVACMAREPRKDGIELTLDVPDVKLAVRPVDLQQVLLNLLLNARTALKSQRGGKLTITASVEADLVHIHVRDTGPGIPTSIQDRLFEPFVTERQGDIKGTGLGLSICRDLVRNAGGSIHFTTAAGQGTTFTLTLPLADELFES